MALSGLVLAVVFASGERPRLGMGGSRIAILEVDGTITDDRALLEDLRDFREDPSVKGWGGGALAEHLLGAARAA